MTMPVKLPGPKRRYTDNDEAERRRARAISQISKAYQEGGAYDDIDNRRNASDAFNAERDYDMLKRVRHKVLYPSPSKPKG